MLRHAEPSFPFYVQQSAPQQAFAFEDGFGGADKRAKEFAINLRRDRVHVKSLPREKFAGVFDVINARGFDFGFSESGRLSLFR